MSASRGQHLVREPVDFDRGLMPRFFLLNTEEQATYAGTFLEVGLKVILAN
jgi:hypothetical protein